MVWEEQKTSNIWIPEALGEEIIGIVEEKKAGLYGDQWLLKLENREKLWTPSHKVLQNMMNNIIIGDTVKIEFRGTEESKTKGRKPTQIYKVWIKKG